MQKSNNQIVIYKSKDRAISLNVNLKNESVWLNQTQIAELFDRDQSVISRHINNVFKENELDKNSVYANFAYTASDGKTYEVAHYNLDVIISVGYRVKSLIGTQFRIWATQVLKNHIIQGYTINENRLKKQTAKIEKLQRSVQILSDIIQTKQLM